MIRTLETNRYTYFGLLATLSFLLFLGEACVPPQKEVVITTVELNTADSTFQRIIDWQDLRQVEDLYGILNHSNPAYRYLAARAFGSIPEEAAIDSLAPLLKDPVEEVRVIAAFALGQIGDPKALPYLIKAFNGQGDTSKVHQDSRRAILEAVGKCGDAETLEQISHVTTYTVRDTALLEGQAWSIYRFGLRQITNPAGTQRMLAYIEPGQYPESVRMIAANYLARIPVALDSFASPIISGFEKSEDPRVRMALAIALGKTRQPIALTSLQSQYQRERDYRVKCNILRALSNFPYEGSRTLVTEALRDPNEHVARRAAQYLLEQTVPEDAAQWWRFAKDSLPTPIHLALYRVANRHLPAYRTEYRDAINFELRQQYAATNSPYVQAEILRALSEFAWNYRYIFREGMGHDNPIVRTAAFECLQGIGDWEGFEQFFGLSTRRVTNELADYFMEGIRSGEPGAIAVSAQALRSTERDYRPYVDSISVLTNALEQLELPAMVETYNELGQTISYLEGNDEFEALIPKYNHPIDWKTLTQFGSQPELRLETNLGEVRIQLWPTVAPGTVANIIALAEDGFLEGKAFHRVVPNFVIQGGSPTGDAYGSLDYSIRSEFSSIHYNQEGMLGMASAGPDTEGTQFFITHSPTLHLDGRYTVFGRVVKGMDVVHRIQVGDRISTAEVIAAE
jgi:cyclophilin family peptidyl-prolyl cis-trans isomerase/HEAT repeat protein